MFTKFKVNSMSISILRAMVGTDIQLLSQTQTNEGFYRDILNIAIGNDGIIDGSNTSEVGFSFST